MNILPFMQRDLADVVKELEMGGHTRGMAQIITIVLKNGREKQKKSQREMSLQKEDTEMCNTVGFEDSGNRSLEYGRSKENDSLLHSSERNTVLLTP